MLTRTLTIREQAFRRRAFLAFTHIITTTITFICSFPPKDFHDAHARRCLIWHAAREVASPSSFHSALRGRLQRQGMAARWHASGRHGPASFSASRSLTITYAIGFLDTRGRALSPAGDITFRRRREILMPPGIIYDGHSRPRMRELHGLSRILYQKMSSNL